MYASDTVIALYHKKDCNQNATQYSKLTFIGSTTNPIVYLDLSLISNLTDDTFVLRDTPIVARRLNMERQGSTGHGVVRVDMTLSGFIEGKRHSELVAIYQRMESLVGRNNMYLTYYAGNTNVISDKQVYIDSVDEPEGWKQYQGAYQISMHYFVNVCDTPNDFGIIVTYTPIDAKSFSGITPTIPSNATTYTFDPPPLWQLSAEKTNQPPTSPGFMPSGTAFGKEVKIILSGILKADDHSKLLVKMKALETGVKGAGLLNYGDWSGYCFNSGGVLFGEILPHSHVNYTIQLISYDNELQLLECERSFTRVHKHTRVTERLYCHKTEVEQFHESGQYVDYSMKIRGKTRQDTRVLLKREFVPFLIPGGFEMPGGTEKWTFDQAIQLNTRYYYPEAVLANVNVDDAIGTISNY